MVSKSLYLQRDTAGLCVRCGGSRKDSLTKQCLSCINGAKIKRDIKKTTLTDQGLCVLCGENEVAINDKYCAKCHAKKKEIDRKVYQSRIENKICVKCKKASSTPYCSECSNKKSSEKDSKIKERVCSILGGKCASCDETNIDNLIITSVSKTQVLRGEEAEKEISKYITNFSKRAWRLQCNACYRLECIAKATPMAENYKLPDIQLELPMDSSEIEDTDV